MNAIPIACSHVVPNDPERRVWLLATAAAGGTAAVATAEPFISTFAPSERAQAAGGPVEVAISDMPPGGVKTVEWRGKPATTGLRKEHSQARGLRRHRHLHPPGLLTQRRPQRRQQPEPVG